MTNFSYSALSSSAAAVADDSSYCCSSWRDVYDHMCEVNTDRDGLSSFQACPVLASFEWIERRLLVPAKAQSGLLLPPPIAYGSNSICDFLFSQLQSSVSEKAKLVPSPAMPNVSPSSMRVGITTFAWTLPAVICFLLATIASPQKHSTPGGPPKEEIGALAVSLLGEGLGHVRSALAAFHASPEEVEENVSVFCVAVCAACVLHRYASERYGGPSSAFSSSHSAISSVVVLSAITPLLLGTIGTSVRDVEARVMAAMNEQFPSSQLQTALAKVLKGFLAAAGS
jgi:hypothetical protein